MITLDETPKLKQGGKYLIPFSGLSTDTKPAEFYDNLPIANGSTFMELNTKKVYFYDEEHKQWV